MLHEELFPRQGNRQENHHHHHLVKMLSSPFGTLGTVRGLVSLLIVGALLSHPPALVKNWHLVLVLAGILVIFFTVADVVLCFGFRMRIMLITLRWLSCG